MLNEKMETVEPIRDEMARIRRYVFSIKSSYMPMFDGMTLPATVIERVKSSGNMHVPCDECGSFISAEYLRSTTCPICRSRYFLYSDCERREMERLLRRLDWLREQEDKASA